MYNRAEAIDQNFLLFVKEGKLPEARVNTTIEETDLKPAHIIEFFESQCLSRHLDLRARVLKNKGICYYTIGSSGHEGNAVFGRVFKSTDMALLHYRSGAFMLQRQREMPGQTPIYDTLLSFMASKDDPIAGGRHKVWGSHKLNVPPQTSTIASQLPKAIGIALSLSRAKELNLQAPLDSEGIVVCSFGDASANHSVAVGAINTASWTAYQGAKLPLVFICEDNGIGISVSTPKNWIEKSYSDRPSLKYIHMDGLHLIDAYRGAREAEQWARVNKQPVFLHMDCVRLMGHAGSDVEHSYRTMQEIEATEFNDPLLHSARILIENGWLSIDEVIRLYKDCEKRVEHVSNVVITRPALEDPVDVESTITANRFKRSAPAVPEKTTREEMFGKEFAKLKEPAHLAKLINWALMDLLLQYPNTLVFGEDVAQKGGVYNVTEGLHARFGTKRVFNSLLDETSILGNAIGFAHNGFVPLPEIQFLAYIHNAEDQLRGEASTLAFFSQGQFTNPMVIRIAGLPYQKGFGGHFHNDNSLAIFRDIPGIVLAVPSNGADAAQMLRTCVREAHENGRVCVFVEPIALYMTRDLAKEGDKGWTFAYPEPAREIPLGEFGTFGDGKDLAIVTYGNGVYYSMQAKKDLEEKHNIKIRVVDLRWITNINWPRLKEFLKPCSHVLVVDECRKSGSPSEGLVAGLVENLNPLPKIKVEAARDCFIPLGKSAAGGLPSRASITSAAEALLGLRA